jgi:hypothetical protein
VCEGHEEERRRRGGGGTELTMACHGSKIY